MRLDANDRSRLVFACLLTAVALPAIWWANEDEGDTGRPNVAAAGVPADEAAPSEGSTSDTIDIVDPAYLTPPASTIVVEPAPRPSVQVGSTEYRVLASVDGTYRRSVSPGRCEVSGVDADGTVTVYNPANGQSVTCRIGRGDAAAPTVVLNPTDFDSLADFTDAPVRVELRD